MNEKPLKRQRRCVGCVGGSHTYTMQQTRGSITRCPQRARAGPQTPRHVKTRVTSLPGEKGTRTGGLIPWVWGCGKEGKGEEAETPARKAEFCPPPLWLVSALTTPLCSVPERRATRRRLQRCVVRQVSARGGPVCGGSQAL